MLGLLALRATLAKTFPADIQCPCLLSTKFAVVAEIRLQDEDIMNMWISRTDSNKLWIQSLCRSSSQSVMSAKRASIFVTALCKVSETDLIADCTLQLLHAPIHPIVPWRPTYQHSSVSSPRREALQATESVMNPIPAVGILPPHLSPCFLRWVNVYA